MTFQKRKKAHVASPALKREATSARSSFRSITGGIVKKSDPPNIPQLPPDERFFWAAWNKQCMLAAGKHQKLISWRKETTWRSKTLMLGFCKTHLGPPDEGQTCCRQWCFDSLVNSSPFSQGNIVCTYQFFSVCSIRLLKYTPSKVVQFFTAQAW